ncbi:MAG: hypothetical protein FGM62_00170 [Methylobacterium sp.]|nr:hypothetical protein [Methylobacterium sp.]
MQSPPNDQQQFEEVLSRLDAILNRGHPPLDDARDSHASPAGMQAEAQSPAYASEANQSLTGPDTVMSGEVPVLTEIYAPVAEAGPVMQNAPGLDSDIEQAILDRWLPLLHQAMDEIVEEEIRRFKEGLQQRLHLQVADVLRQHLRALKTQTEM